MRPNIHAHSQPVVESSRLAAVRLELGQAAAMQWVDPLSWTVVAEVTGGAMPPSGL